MKENCKVEVCANCSGFDVAVLKDKVKAKTSCIGKCSKLHPELSGKVYGFLNGAFTVCATEADFIAKIDALGDYTPDGNRNPLVDAFLESVPKWRAEFDALRTIVLECDFCEELKWGQPCYTVQDGNVLILGGFKAYIALNFFKGALLSDPENRLVQQTENVQAARQLRFTSASEIAAQKEIILQYIREAIEIEKAGLDLPAQARSALDCPAELETKFNECPDFKTAFYALTPGRQRGYLYHFSQPKQSKTREARVEKYTQKIMDGKGMED